MIYSATFYHFDSPMKLQLSLKEGRGLFSPLKGQCRKNLIQDYVEILNSGEVPIVVNSKLPKLVKEEMILKIKSHFDANELGHILCTSGTTSDPKSYFFKIENALANAKAHNKSLGLRGGEKVLFPLPITHSFGIVVGILASLDLKSDTYFLEETDSVLEVLNILKKQKFDILYLTPSLLRQLNRFIKRNSQELIAPRKISIGSSSLLYEDLETIKQAFPESEIFYTYGLTEMGPRVSTFKVDSLRVGRIPIGLALDGIEWKVTDRLLIKSPYSAIEYQNQFFDSSDKVEKVEENLYITGRLDDIIIYQGININPLEIEQLLKSINVDAVVIGATSEMYGEVPIMVLEESSIPSVDQEKIFEFLKIKLPESHIPKKIVTIQKFDRTEMGKIQRSKIKSSLEF
ncbi:MAG: hypothetical protein CME65_08910 [Halobacteriovoraceae bacterium]|nr:hypothetical protein [Halobacteriovoraceae bacterium]|tara:strand:+ start:5651 stop:6856 length:1206 start_codon:yes stop_codon:yes gene_type:complete